MAEYASALLGIVAFGLQACKVLNEYYESFKDQNRSIAKTVSDAKALQELLVRIKDLLQQEQHGHVREGVDKVLEDIVAGCDLALQELNAELDKIRPDLHDKDGGMFVRFTHGVRRLKYPFKESTLLKLRESVNEVRDNLGLAFDIRQSVALDAISHSLRESQMVLKALNTKFDKAEARNWLRAPDPWSDLYAAAEKRHDGTGLWLLSGDGPDGYKYQRWLHHPGKTFLWLTGFAGTGKSVLASSIVQDVSRRLSTKSALAFFFFNFRDQSKQSASGFVRSLIQQLFSSGTSELLEQFHVDHQHQQPSLEDLLGLLVAVVNEYDAVYVVADAVDEIPTGARNDQIFHALHALRAEIGVHLLVTSRDEAGIRDGLQVGEDELISLQNPNVDKDVKLFIQESIVKNVRLAKWRDHHDEIEVALTRQSRGMFRWVECQFISLERCKTLNALRRCLSTLPPTLNGTYDRILAGVDRDANVDLQRALAFLCFSLRPMMVCELVDAMAVQPDGTSGFDSGDRIQDYDDLLNLLPGLLSMTPWREGEHVPGFGTVVSASSTAATSKKHHKIHFAHASVKDYFLSGDMADSFKAFHVTKTAAHETIIKCSLTYVLTSRIDYPRLQPSERPIEIYPFVRYAAEELSDHLKLCDRRMDFMDDTVELLGADQFCTEVILYRKQNEFCATASAGADTARSRQFCNISRLSQTILRPDLSSKQQDLLCAATFMVHACVVDMAIATVTNLFSELRRTGFEDSYMANVLLWLLAQVNSFDSLDCRDMCHALVGVGGHDYGEGSLLYQALLCRHAYWGDLETLSALLPKTLSSKSQLVMQPINAVKLQEEVELSMQSSSTNILLPFLQYIVSSPICCAIQARNWQVVQYFLDSGCLDWCKRDQQGQLALDIAMCAAAAAGNIDLVKVFLEAGASPKYNDDAGTGFTALHRATLKSELRIMDVLLDHGAEIEARTRFGTTALHFACRKPDPAVARLLLNRGAKIAATNSLGLTGLHFAALRALEGNIELMLQAGADPFKRNSVGATPRQLLLIHLQKWTGVNDSHKRGFLKRAPAALRALENGEKKWQEVATAAISLEESRQVSKVSVGHKEDVKASQIGKAEQADNETRHERDTESPSADDIIDIFIQVPQFTPGDKQT